MCHICHEANARAVSQQATLGFGGKLEFGDSGGQVVKEFGELVFEGVGEEEVFDLLFPAIFIFQFWSHAWFVCV